MFEGDRESSLKTAGPFGCSYPLTTRLATESVLFLYRPGSADP